MTPVNSQKIAEAITAAKCAKSDAERDGFERQAIAHFRQDAIETGLDEMLCQRATRDGRKAAHLVSDLTLRDIQHQDNSLRGLFWWGALASFLNDLRLGPYRKKEGEGVIHAAKAASEGRRSWLMKPVTRQGVKPDGENTDALYFSVVGLAATYDAVCGCGVRAALHYAVTEYVAGAAAIGLSLDPETLRRRVNGAGDSKRRGEDKLSTHYRQMLKLMQRQESREAVVTANRKIMAMNATIRGKTSPSREN